MQSFSTTQILHSIRRERARARERANRTMRRLRGRPDAIAALARRLGL